MPSTALAAAPQRPPRLHWEQALILAVAAVVLALGIDWGLPSRERVELLTGGSPLSEAEIRLLDSVRNTRRENRDARLAQAAENLTGAGESSPPRARRFAHRCPWRTSSTGSARF